MLKAGLYRSHVLGKHRASSPTGHRALIQQGGPVTVIRDGSPNYEDTGFFGINIHRGGNNSTSSLGCQTVPPSQWLNFIGLVENGMRRHGVKVMPYLLVEQA